MLESVPHQAAKAIRAVVVKHPQRWNVQVLRKVVTRTDAPAGGLPTLGGLMVLDSEDESSYDYEWIGNGLMVEVERFQPAMMVDRQDANHGQDVERVLIEPEAMPGTAAWFSVKKHDVVYKLLAAGLVRLAYEVVGIETPADMGDYSSALPYVQRYVLNRRDDLQVVIP